MAEAPRKTVSAPLVALAGWLVPGAGYWLLGHRARGVTVCVCVVALFVMGLLIGGVRAVEVPGYGDHGYKLMAVTEFRRGVDRQGREGEMRIQRVVEMNGEHAFDPPEDRRPDRRVVQGWVMRVHPFQDVRNKPWSIAQVMAGPVGIAGAAGSVWASRPASQGGDEAADDGPPRGARSHGRINDIAVLYTAVAGMLNLLAIIDAAHRAGPKRPEGAGATSAGAGGVVTDTGAPASAARAGAGA